MGLNNNFLQGAALILGASSGFGGACSVTLARCGMDVFGVHLDRKSTLSNVEALSAEIGKAGRKAHFFNVNAADAEKRKEVLETIQKECEGPFPVRILVHSLAFGTLKSFIAPTEQGTLSQPQMQMTLDVMAHSLVYWVQDLVRSQLMGKGGRVFAMTSEGGRRVWESYGAVSAAKSALESHVRQLAVELAPYEITVNALCAGVTDTPALRKIPGHETMIQSARTGNPMGRLTTPADVAGAIALLAHPMAGFITGNVINVDGGESISGRA